MVLWITLMVESVPNGVCLPAWFQFTEADLDDTIETFVKKSAGKIEQVGPTVAVRLVAMHWRQHLWLCSLTAGAWAG